MQNTHASFAHDTLDAPHRRSPLIYAQPREVTVASGSRTASDASFQAPSTEE
jgi:hypothetical protein